MGLFGNVMKFVDPGNALSDPFNPVAHTRNVMQNFGFGSKPPPGFDPSAWASMGSIEQQSGIKPPDYESIRDASGMLKDAYKLDPYAGEATQALKSQAFASGASPWADMQTQMLNRQVADARDQAAKQAMQATAQSQSELAKFGGLSGGARQALARQQSRNLMTANQGIGREGLRGRMDIGAQDLNRKQDLLGKFATGEQQAQQGNIGMMMQDIAGKQAFDMNRYNEQMRAWAANKSAEAQARAASQAGGGGKK